MSWCEQTKVTELIICFFEQVTKHSTAVAIDENQAFFNLSKEKVGDLTVFDEAIYQLNEIRGSGETTMEAVEGNHLVATLEEIDDIVAHLRKTSTHFK